MWISIGVVPHEQKIIFLPKVLSQKLGAEIDISFGKKTTRALTKAIDESWDIDITSFDNPIKVMFSSKLKSVLQIPYSLTYQMKIRERGIEIGPVIGLLLGNYNHLYSPEHMEKYSDRFGVLKNVGGLIYAFSPRAINWENEEIFGIYYNYKNKAWQYGRFPFPSVIYRRDFHSSDRIVEKLRKATNNRLFNSWRFTKYFLYEYIGKNRELSGHLPVTELVKNYDQVQEFIDAYGKVILKPIDLSRGRGICVISKEDNEYIVEDYRPRISEKTIFRDEEELRNFFDLNKSFFDKYLIQEYISLAKIDNSNFDIRVVMQKNRMAKWKCSGIECRVACDKSLLTNISRGGYALTIDQALERAFPDIDSYEELKRQLYDLCERLCIHLDSMKQHFAEFGMDIAIDKNKNFWIIEVNVFPSFKGFKKMDYKTYLTIRHTPILYAAHLAKF